MIVPTRRLIALCALVVPPAAGVMALGGNWAMAAAGLLAGLFIAAAADGFAGSGRKPIHIDAPAFFRLTQGSTAPLNLTLWNDSSQSIRGRIALILPPGVSSEQSVRRIELIPGASALEYIVTAKIRGEHKMEQAQMETASPLGLWNVRWFLSLTCGLRVYPNLRDRATAALFQRRENVGTRIHRQVGKGREFDRLRQFIAGDSYEDVYWKGTARRGSPVVKLYTLEHSQQVYVALDCSRLSALESRLDDYIQAALHLALCAERQGDRFGLILFSDRVHAIVDARRGPAHFRACRDAIYNAQSNRVNPDFGEVCDSLQRRLRRRSLIIFLTCLDDAFLAETFERDIAIMARRHVVLVHLLEGAQARPMFSGRAPESLDEAYMALAGQLQWNNVRRLQLALQNRGVRLSILEQGKAKQQVAAAYLDVKRRQLL